MKKKNLYAVILAGGSGTRFWPKSRQDAPKQFLKITGKKSLFQMTLKRISSKVKGGRLYIVTNERYAPVVRRQAASMRVPPSHILCEPKGKNTAPAICWAAARISQKDSRAVMAVLPSDHLINNTKVFLKVMGSAVRLAQAGHLVTFGISPTRPDTGYGYLKTKKISRGRAQVLRVEKFIEKPSHTKAARFIKNKGYFWNSGMFVWKAETILAAFKKYQPRIHKLLAGNPSDAAVPSISIDYGILEKAANVAAVPARNMGWSDLGSWESLTAVLKKDRAGNIVSKNAITLKCRNTSVFGNQRLIAAVGLDDIIIVDTKDALLVCRKDVSQKVRDVVDIVRKRHKSCM